MIAAAGSGERLGAGGPKALVELAGRPLIAWSVAAASAAQAVAAIIVAAPPGHERAVERLVPPGTRVVAGGDSRSQSVARAAGLVETDLVAVHDAARPLAAPALFDVVLRALADDQGAAGAIPATPVADTLKRATGEPPAVVETVSRDGLWAVQTPQAFRTLDLRAALDADPVELAAATDDAMLVERRGGRVLIVPAAASNPKVTTAADLRQVELLAAERGTSR